MRFSCTHALVETGVLNRAHSGYEDSPGGCPQRSTSLTTDANVGTAAVPRPYRPG